MAGLLTHVSVALIGGLIFGFGIRNFKCGIAFGLGSLIPDLLSFGIPAVKILSLDFGSLMREDLFGVIAPISHSFYVWGVLCFVLTLGLLIFHEFDKISRKRFWEIVVCEVLFLGAIILHLVLDKVVVESNFWI